MFVHELPDAKELFLIVSEVKRVDPYLVEKDYWIMHALWGLQRQNIAFDLKGGTSLSKGFGILDRFSEDIDIKIEPTSRDNVKAGRNQDKNKHIESRRLFFDGLAEKISIAGMETMREPDYDDLKVRNGAICLIYASLFDIPETIKPSILLEVGFDKTTPNEAVTIDSWAYTQALMSGVRVSDNRAKNVKCYLSEYTFVEKLQTISTKVRQQQKSGEFGTNFLRHFYDIHMLLNQTRVIDFIGTDAYFTHKRNRFRGKDELDLKNNMAFNLDQNVELFNRYEQEYAKIGSLFISGTPGFKEIYNSIIRIRNIA